MDILIPDSWLREHITTKASGQKLAECLSLCGPTVDRIHKIKGDVVYQIEVTTNRVDAISVYGIAREVAAILPQFGLDAKLKKLNLSIPKQPEKSLPLIVKSNNKLVYRTIGIVVDDIKNWKTPEWMKRRLEASGQRSINSIVDITNYVMLELGHPIHAFDYDKIPNATIIVREAKRGERITSLENKSYILNGGDIVFESVNKEIIDLPGIIGTKNSVVNSNTKRVLFFIDNNDPKRIRKSSMSLGIRTTAAAINEKGVDPNLGLNAILKAVDMAKTICGAKIASKIYDNFPSPPKEKSVVVKYPFILDRLGVDIPKTKISSMLALLEFTPKWKNETLSVGIPSFRMNDISIPEDIVEEIARLYGYNRLPSAIMNTAIPDKNPNAYFDFELKIKRLLQLMGGLEIYTQSLVPKVDSMENAVKIENPLGNDSKYLRTNMLYSHLNAAKSNSSVDRPFFLFEISNIYLPSTKLPEEKVIVAGIFANTKYRRAKGIVENLLDNLNITYSQKIDKIPHFTKSESVSFISNKENLGFLGKVDNFYYFEFELVRLFGASNPVKQYREPAKYPAQIEDLTFVLPANITVTEVIELIKSTSKLISKTSLQDIFGEAYTFRVYYQDKNKTLTDDEVSKLRKDIIIALSKLNILLKA